MKRTDIGVCEVGAGDCSKTKGQMVGAVNCFTRSWALSVQGVEGIAEMDLNCALVSLFPSTCMLVAWAGLRSPAAQSAPHSRCAFDSISLTERLKVAIHPCHSNHSPQPLNSDLHLTPAPWRGLPNRNRTLCKLQLEYGWTRSHRTSSSP